MANRMDWEPRMRLVEDLYSTEQRAAIAKILETAEAKRERLFELVEKKARYYFLNRDSAGKPPPSKCEEKIARIRRKVDELYEFTNRGELPASIVQYVGYDLGEMIQELHAEAKRVHENVSSYVRQGGKGARKKDLPLIALIYDLCAIYNEFMGRQDRLTALKCRFLRACLEPIGLSLTTDQLRKRHRQALEWF